MEKNAKRRGNGGKENMIVDLLVDCYNGIGGECLIKDVAGKLVMD